MRPQGVQVRSEIVRPGNIPQPYRGRPIGEVAVRSHASDVADSTLTAVQ
jgi:hypothetical protein